MLPFVLTSNLVSDSFESVIFYLLQLKDSINILFKLEVQGPGMTFSGSKYHQNTL